MQEQQRSMPPAMWVSQFLANLQRMGSTESPASLMALGERLYVFVGHLSPEEAAEAITDRRISTNNGEPTQPGALGDAGKHGDVMDG